MGVPGYFLAGGVFADHGFAEGMKGVPEDKAGEIDTSWLGEKLRESDERNDKSGEIKKPVCIINNLSPFPFPPPCPPSTSQTPHPQK